jgi:asparagine synthase (glutamine-hydrolysing)
VWEKGNHYLEPYWELEYEPKHTASEADLIVELRARLRQATYMRMISEVPLGAHLSGGIDSSIVVALMAEFSPEPVKTFSVGFEETGFSELPYAKSVAERYATDHQEFILTFGDIPATLEELLYHFGEPFADPSALPLFHISRITRQYVTVALNGDGGDEAFAGYLRYWLDPWANRYARLPGFINRGLIPGFAGLFPVQAEQPVGASLINGLKRLKQLTEVDPRASILRWSSYFSESLRRELWQPDMQAHLDLHAAEILHTGKFEKANAKTFLERTLYTDNTEYLPGDLLVKADRMTMANSLEGRSPFLDHELAGWAARIPQRLKLRGSKGKYILRKAFSDMLPPQVLNRGKQGFGIPVGTWMRGPLAEWSREILLSPHPHYSEWFERQTLERILDEHQKGRIDHGKRIWALVILSLWAQSV